MVFIQATRRSPRVLRGLITTACLAACGGDGQDATAALDTDVCPAPSHMVIRKLSFVRTSDGVSDGFDLDGQVSSARDAGACPHQDATGLDGTPGVDNAFAGILPLLDLTEARVLEELMQFAIDSGELVMLLELGDPTLEGCGTFRIMRASGDIRLGTDGLILGGQTLELDDTLTIEDPVEAWVSSDGIESRDFGFRLPLQIFDASLDFTFQSTAARLRAQPEDDTWTGILSGGIAWQDVLDGLLDSGASQEVKDLLLTVGPGLADLAPDESGDCQAMSAGLSFEAVPAFLFEGEL